MPDQGAPDLRSAYQHLDAQCDYQHRYSQRQCQYILFSSSSNPSKQAENDFWSPSIRNGRANPTMEDESSPPDSAVPTGTSLRKRMRTASVNKSRNRSIASSSLSGGAWRCSCSCHQRTRTGREAFPFSFPCQVMTGWYSQNIFEKGAIVAVYPTMDQIISDGSLVWFSRHPRRFQDRFDLGCKYKPVAIEVVMERF